MEHYDIQPAILSLDLSRIRATPICFHRRMANMMTNHQNVRYLTNISEDIKKHDILWMEEILHHLGWLNPFT